jgi:hypothetical protein
MGSTSISVESNHGWWRSWLAWLYQRLTRNDTPRPADLIFVMAGRMERKQYGLDLFRAGFAPRLLLSVGRFEVRRMRAIGFEKADELIAYRDRTAPSERHFFCEIRASEIRMAAPRLAQWNTYGELEALREVLQHDMPRTVIFLSTDIHLRRVAVTFAKVFHDAPLEACFCPVPSEYGSCPDLRYVLAETLKLAGYRAILRLPDPLIRRIMRLRHYLG